MKKENIRVEELDNDYRIYSFEDYSAYEGAFGNCQNFSVNNFESLLWSDDSDSVNDTNSFLYYVSEMSGKKFAIIDIRPAVYERLKYCIKQSKLLIRIVANTPYMNNNAHDMILCVLDLNDLRSPYDISRNI
jgi:hypothetical protein